LIAAQLDDQLKLLKKNVKALTVKQLEWQPRPGVNTIGMLLAHLALAEFWWIKVAPLDIAWEPDGQAMILKALGFEDDGIPLPPNGVHPDYLRGYTAEKYLAVLAKARRAIHREMKASWFDRDLDKYYRLGKRQISRSWTLYHILEHFGGHYGQTLLLKHLMRDAGVLVEKDKK
jgi:hypothetical protein